MQNGEWGEFWSTQWAKTEKKHTNEGRMKQKYEVWDSEEDGFLRELSVCLSIKIGKGPVRSTSNWCVIFIIQSVFWKQVNQDSKHKIKGKQGQPV